VTQVESNATGWSFAFLRTLVENGVTDIVVCPGSRSQSLALLAAEFADRELLTLHVVLDERAAGFLALGMSIESGRPTVVVTTSGSSVANLHPAVVEAFHQGTPLLLVTADRPESVRGRGVGQTTFHVGRPRTRHPTPSEAVPPSHSTLSLPHFVTAAPSTSIRSSSNRSRRMFRATSWTPSSPANYPESCGRASPPRFRQRRGSWLLRDWVRVHEPNNGRVTSVPRCLPRWRAAPISDRTS